MTAVIGLDLGQLNDYTALTVLESVDGAHQLRHLDRWHGKPYTELIPALEGLLSTIRQQMARGESPVLVVDRTGVGVAVVDQLRAANLDCELAAVNIHGGDRTVYEGG